MEGGKWNVGLTILIWSSADDWWETGIVKVWAGVYVFVMLVRCLIGGVCESIL